MFRALLFSVSCLTVSACVSSGAVAPAEILARAEADTQLRKEIDTLSTYAVAKYAGLTDDPQTSARHYARLLRQVHDDPWVAEQAIFSILRIGEVPRAVALAKRLPPETLDETELPRLLLAIEATRRGDSTAALAHLDQPWRNDYHAMLARSLAAWNLLDDDPQSAIALQQQAGGEDGLFTLMGQTLAAIMKANSGDEAGARSDLGYLFDLSARLALGVETEARLLALAGDEEKALQRLTAFRTEVGRHPALTALADEIEAGAVTPMPSYSAAEGTALAIYLATAPQASQGYGDVPAVYFAMASYLDPDLDVAKTLWADVLDQSDRRPEAIALLKTITDESVHHTSAQGQLAWALRREGRDDEALIIARETLARTDDRNIRVQLADLLQSLGRDGEAEDTFTDIIEADEAEGHYDWRIYYARGGARERLGEWPRAENDLQTAMNLRPDNPTIMNYLGYSWIDRGINLDEGLALIETALRYAPDNGAITDSLGWAHYKLGNYERAIFYLERAAELEPTISEILDHLGDAYWQVGRFKEAGFQWERALKYAADEEERDLLNRKLAGGIALLQAVNDVQTPAFP
ncbi:MAG: tetratricopeptide repeat protein [Hyphomonadaceae bacterium]|nr:tetratricopeptide repeat protein [Hyphomonadaceae bacterium]